MEVEYLCVQFRGASVSWETVVRWALRNVKDGVLNIAVLESNRHEAGAIMNFKYAGMSQRSTYTLSLTHLQSRTVVTHRWPSYVSSCQSCESQYENSYVRSWVLVYDRQSLSQYWDLAEMRPMRVIL